MAVVHIGVGSNLGDRAANCGRAVELLGRRGIRVRKRSSLHETEPWGLRDQPRFLNMALEAETGLGPRDLLLALKAVEAEMGRAPAERYGPRVIDLDILLYGSLAVKEPGLEIPHPRMHERAFVLAPLSEIAPRAVHPVLGKTVEELMAELEGGAQ
ncbi:MAG: 2-amino-4-hydroxy-6-hydroxymethyldihydropteridine diphosphokinase [Thermodesulfovibrionales bacterium]